MSKTREITPTDMAIGEALKNSREKAGLTQQQSAEAIGIDRVSLARWEAGDRAPRIADLPKIAEVYGISTMTLAKKILGKISDSALTL